LGDFHLSGKYKKLGIPNERMPFMYSVIHILCERPTINKMHTQSINNNRHLYAFYMFRRLRHPHGGMYIQWQASTAHTPHIIPRIFCICMFFIYLPDDDRSEVETCRRRMHYYYYFYNSPSGCCVWNVNKREIN
jgi:hypothetical protein